MVGADMNVVVTVFPLPGDPSYFVGSLALPVAGGSEEVIAGLPVQHRYEGNVFSGEKRTELQVVPAISVRVSRRMKARLYREEIEIPYPVRPPRLKSDGTPAPDQAEAGASSRG